MRTLALIVVLGITGLNSVAQPFRLPDAPISQNPYTNLLTVGRFAFGGVGIAGLTSRGEVAFRATAASTNALTLFSAALTNGNAQAKLYALCGIRRFAPASFDSYAKALRISNPIVETMSGCVIHHEFATNVIARISAGSYDAYFKSPKQ